MVLQEIKSQSGIALTLFIEIVHKELLKYKVENVKPGFHCTTNATNTTQKQSDYKVEQSSFTVIALL